jgi:hypothetical protein
MLERDQGTYGGMIFEKAEFSPEQPPLLIKDKRISLWSEGCGFQQIKLDHHFKLMAERYKQESSEHMVGIADVKIKTYTKFLVLTAVPCMRVEATPFIVKSWEKKRLK